MQWMNKGHEFDRNEAYLKETQTIYFYGCIYYQDIFEQLQWVIRKSNHDQVDLDFVFVDRDPKKQASLFHGYTVISPERFYAEFKENHGLVVICTSDESMPAILKEMLADPFYQRKFNVFTTTEFWRSMTLLIWFRYQKLFFHLIDLFISSYCNLNCEACCIQIPRGKKRKTDLERLQSNIDALFSHVDYVGYLVFGMGDGLIYDHLVETFDYVGTHYPDRLFKQRVVTNGTIVPNEDVLASLQRNHVNVVVDDYRANVPLAVEKYPEVIQALQSHGVDYNELLREYWEDIKFGDTDNSGMSEQELDSFMTNCACHFKGFPFWGYDSTKVFSCVFQTVSNHLRLVDEGNDDYFDWNKSSRIELIEYIMGYTERGYLSACKKCAGVFEGRTVKRIPVAVQIDKGNK